MRIDNNHRHADNGYQNSLSSYADADSGFRICGCCY
jgi:hypothetical protein